MLKHIVLALSMAALAMTPVFGTTPKTESPKGEKKYYCCEEKTESPKGEKKYYCSEEKDMEISLCCEEEICSEEDCNQKACFENKEVALDDTREERESAIRV